MFDIISKKRLLLQILLISACSTYAQNVGQRPDILIILADDLGWNDLSCYGSTFYETPFLDSLAARGVRYTQAYSTSPVCSPARASILTGKNPVKTGVTDWIKGRQEGGKARPYEKLVAKPTAYHLKANETTIAEFAMTYGYRTFFAGKWHLGEREEYWPEHEGFQINKGGWSSGSPTGKVDDTTGGFFTPYRNPRLADGPNGEYLTDRLNTECIEFLDKIGDERFLMMYSLYAVHNPLQAPAELIKKYEAKKRTLAEPDDKRFAKDEEWMKHENGWQRRLIQDNPVYAAMIESMDTNIGKLLRKLKSTGRDKNTLIIFTSDNGGLSTAEGSPTTNGTLRNGKGWLHEGGIRVPFILFWNGVIVPGSTSGVPVTLSDVYPTIAKAIEPAFRKDEEIDGYNLLTLLSPNDRDEQRSLFWHYPHYSNQGGKPGSAIRKNNLKLIFNYEDKSTELYDLTNDPSERNNLVTKHPKVAKQLRRELQQWLKENGALYPYPNPGYKPD